MSLIVDVNPVPWKILDLVRARILKNRAKKKKVDQGFSATAIRREINAQQGLLAKRRMEEPSFLIQDQGRYGVGWLHIGENYTVTSFETASLELVFTVGTGSGETWKQVRHTVNYSISTFSSNFHGTLLFAVFPAGQSDIVLIFTIAQFQHVFDSSGRTLSFNATSTRQISLLITVDNITELTHPVPIFHQRLIDYWMANGPFGNLRYLTEGAAVFKNIGATSLGISATTTSSAIFESILPEGPSHLDAYNVMNGYSPQQAKASYVAVSANTGIPVLGYKRDDPSAAITPTTERGVFGIIPGASVTAPVTAEMLAARLDDEQVQEPGPNAENRTEPVYMIVAYDYHGGTYCRDQLAALGITLP